MKIRYLVIAFHLLNHFQHLFLSLNVSNSIHILELKGSALLPKDCTNLIWANHCPHAVNVGHGSRVSISHSCTGF